MNTQTANVVLRDKEYMRGFEIAFPALILKEYPGQHLDYEYRVMPQNELLQQCKNTKRCDSTRNKEAKRLHGLPITTSSFIIDRVYPRDGNVIMATRMSCKLKNQWDCRASDVVAKESTFDSTLCVRQQKAFERRYGRWTCIPARWVKKTSKRKVKSVLFVDLIEKRKRAQELKERSCLASPFPFSKIPRMISTNYQISPRQQPFNMIKPNALSLISSDPYIKSLQQKATTKTPFHFSPPKTKNRSTTTNTSRVSIANITIPEDPTVMPWMISEPKKYTTRASIPPTADTGERSLQETTKKNPPFEVASSPHSEQDTVSIPGKHRSYPSCESNSNIPEQLMDRQ